MRKSYLAIFNSALILVLFKYALVSATFSYENSLAKICHKIELPSDLLFIIDGSGSVGAPTFDTQIAALNRIVDSVDIGPNDTQIAVLQYSSYTYIEFGFNIHSTKESLRDAISKLQHKSGTTKTGKALDRALQMFTTKTWGSRFGRNGVQQIAVVVTDGHSRDDPAQAAGRLRQAGVRIIALGIGQHINMNELVDISNDANYAFENLTSSETMENFVRAFRETTITDECEYLRGPEGAQITCNPDSIQVGITMEKEFGGFLYVDGHFDDSKCRYQANSTDFEFNVNLLDCGIARQFQINPRGFVFTTTVILQYHPELSTSLDRHFNVHCFYQDQNEANQLDWQLIKEHTQRKNRDEKSMPCHYSIEPIAKQLDDECERNFFIGDQVTHKFECDADHFDAYQSIFIHNCEYVDLRTKMIHKLIDENGCSLEPNLIETPQYKSPTLAHSKGVMFRRPDSQLGKIRCQIQFCDRLMTDCDRILPPKCHSIDKRESGFAVGIRPLNWDASPPLVTFGKLEKQKMAIKRRLEFDQTVGAVVITKNEGEKRILPTLPVRVEAKSTLKPKLFTKAPVEKSTESDANKSTDPFQSDKAEASGIEEFSSLSENILSKLKTDEIVIESKSFNVQNKQNPTCRFKL